jgi:hypothetical protein
MKLKFKRRIIFSGKTRGTQRLVLVTLAGLVALSERAGAQQVVVPPPTVSVTPPAMPETSSDAMNVFSTENPMSAFLDELQPLQWGPVTLRPHVFYQFAYGTGILTGGNQPNDTIIQSLAPGILFVLSPRWTLDYTPTLTFYSNNNFRDTVGQSVTLTGGTTFEAWVFGISQNFTYSSSPQVQTGTQTSQDTYTTALTAFRKLNSKMSVDLGINQNFNFPTDFQRTLEWSTLDWLNYEFWPRLVVGVGAGAGYIISTPNMVFEQIQGRVNWHATDKTSFQISGGGQFSQFTDGGAAPLINPVFNAAIQYQPFKHTQISVNGGEQVDTSYFANQVNVVTTVGANVNQRLLGRIYLNVGGSYNWNNYTAVADGATASNPVNYYSVNVNLSMTLFKRASASIFYSYNDSTTSQTGLAFSSSQVGFNVGYRY